MSDKNLYFDTAATTPINPEVANLMHEINLEHFGNPSSIHSQGQKSHNIIERSRTEIANILGCSVSELYFTSGGSESNNIVLKGLLQGGDHFITSSYEHPSILGLCDELKNNNIEITLIKPDNNGMINPDEIKNSIRPNTKLISIMYVNNELGVVNPIKEIGTIASENNIYFHTDAVQYIGKDEININNLNIDCLSIGAHKFYGPKGIGILYIKKTCNIKPLISGGGQESGLRAGTENISSIAGMNMALKIAYENLESNKDIINKLEIYFLNELTNKNIDYRLNGVNRIPGILNITFFGVDGHSLLMNLDMLNISISYGSACSSGSATAPMALLEIGMDENEARSSVRISIGKMITKENLDTLVSKLEQVIIRIKK